MKIIAFFAAALLSFAAMADEPPPRSYTLAVTEADLQALSQAIGELPTKVGLPLLTKLQQQVQAQSAPKPEAVLPLQEKKADRPKG